MLAGVGVVPARLVQESRVGPGKQSWSSAGRVGPGEQGWCSAGSGCLSLT